MRSSRRGGQTPASPGDLSGQHLDAHSSHALPLAAPGGGPAEHPGGWAHGPHRSLDLSLTPLGRDAQKPLGCQRIPWYYAARIWSNPWRAWVPLLPGGGALGGRNLDPEHGCLALSECCCFPPLPQHLAVKPSKLPTCKRLCAHRPMLHKRHVIPLPRPPLQSLLAIYVSDDITDKHEPLLSPALPHPGRVILSGQPLPVPRL